MNVCPKCGAVVVDDQQKFCLMDGHELVSGDSEPTVVMPTRSVLPTTVIPAKRKTSPFVWIALGIVILIIAGAAIASLVLYSYKLGTENARSDRNAVGNLSTRSSSTPARTASQALPSPSGEAIPSSKAPPTSGTDASDPDATPIDWTTSGAGFKQETGQTYRFLCPPNGAEAIVWGNDVYTADSSICTAAVHAGLITLETGGEVIMEFRPGRQVYGSTTRNGITSNSFGEYPHSFIVRKPNSDKN